MIDDAADVDTDEPPLKAARTVDRDNGWGNGEVGWATFDWSPEQWVAVLRDNRVDERAAQELFLLAQVDKYAAARIIGKFLKKMSDGVTIHNPSALVHAQVKRANEANGVW